MVDQRVWKLYGEAKRAFEQDRLKATQTINEKLQTLYEIGQILLDLDVEEKRVYKADLVLIAN
jgi:hypothetical protein